MEVADLFVDRGVIVSTARPERPGRLHLHGPRAGAWQMPLVVLIDQDSASAAEIFAGAIRDHHRGTLVGVRSFGKGSVQGIFPLESSEAGLRLTTAKFYSPNGHPYARVGVEPDVTGPPGRPADRRRGGRRRPTATTPVRRGVGSRPQPLAAQCDRAVTAGEIVTLRAR